MGTGALSHADGADSASAPLVSASRLRLSPAVARSCRARVGLRESAGWGAHGDATTWTFHPRRRLGQARGPGRRRTRRRGPGEHHPRLSGLGIPAANLCLRGPGSQRRSSPLMLPRPGRLSIHGTHLDGMSSDLWLCIDPTLICVVHAWDPDGRSLGSPARAARYGARLVESTSALRGRDALEFESETQRAAIHAMKDVEGLFETLIVAVLPQGLWIAGRGRMEVLQPGESAGHPLHRSDSLRWSHPSTPEPVARLATATIRKEGPDPPLRCRLWPSTRRSLVVCLDVPGEALRAAAAEQDSSLTMGSDLLDIPAIFVTYSE
jgi:hypothetical protein